MSLPWFRVDNDLVDHPKVFALAALLSDPNAGWYLVRLWAWTMRYAARGNFADGARTALESACGWRGDAGKLVEALITTGWLVARADGRLEVHDWQEVQGAAVEKARKDAERKRQTRASPVEPAKTAPERRAPGARSAHVQDETIRDETRRNVEEERARAAPTSPPVPKRPTDEERGRSAEAYFRWLQNERLAAGYAIEKPPRGWDECYRQMMQELHADIERIDATVARFMAAPHWAARGAPINALMTEWRKFVPRKAPERAPTEPCACCGSTAETQIWGSPTCFDCAGAFADDPKMSPEPEATFESRAKAWVTERRARRAS